MRIDSKKVVEHVLTLTDEEARYLRGLLQNYVPDSGCPAGLSNEEPERDSEIRSEIWSGLDNSIRSTEL